MARSFNGTNASLESVAPVTVVPLTICGWMKPSAAITSVVAAISTHTGSSSRFQLNLNATVSPFIFQAVVVDSSGTAGFSEVTFAASLGNWYHFAAVFSSSTSRTAYVNGVAGPVSTTSIVPAAPTRFNISGRYFASTLGGFFNGAVAEVSVYNAALTAEDIAAHALAYTPDQIRPGALVYYNDLIRDIRDLRGGLAITEIGTATTVVEHPRIIL